MKSKGHKFYSMKYPMNMLQIGCHKEALRRTVQHYKDNAAFDLTHAQIETILLAIHIYAKFVGQKMHFWKGKGIASIVHLQFGFLRTTWVKALHDLYESGEFTDEEWEYISQELYPGQYKLFNSLNKRKDKWLKKKKLSRERIILAHQDEAALFRK